MPDLPTIAVFQGASRNLPPFSRFEVTQCTIPPLSPPDWPDIPVGRPVSPGDLVLVVPVSVGDALMIRADAGPVFLTRAVETSPRGLVLSVRGGVPGIPVVVDWEETTVFGILPALQMVAERFLLRGRQWWPTISSFHYEMLGNVLEDTEGPKTLN